MTEDGTTSTGTLTISDVDVGDNPSFADVGPNLGDNSFGNFELTGGTWTYTVNNADGLGGNPMPGGTTITFSIDGSGVSMVGTSSFTVDGLASSPTGPYTAAIRADPVDIAGGESLPTGVSLLLTISPPDAPPAQFSWPVTVGP